jgi:CHASE2 domain-containing sensor protein/signal transduction histidine kinase
MSARQAVGIRPLLKEWAVVVTLLVLAVGALSLHDIFWRVDRNLYDLGMTLATRPAPPDIVIVAIDDESLAAIGRWPWRRAVHATLLDRLTSAGARAVALDLILSEADPRDSGGDRALALALRANGKVVLPVLLEGERGSLRETRPVAEFVESAAALGHIDSEIDADGIVRSVYLRGGLGAAHWDHMAVALLRLAEPQTVAVLPGVRAPARTGASALWQRDYWFHIPFAGPPGHYEQVSYSAVLRGEVPAARFKDAIVLVGATASGLSDAYPTPVSAHSRNMPGVEIAANIIDALRTQRTIVIVGPVVSAAVSALSVLLLMLSYLWFTPRRALLVTGALLAITLGTSVLLLAAGSMWFAPSAAAAGIVAAYPLWSWRRLEAAMRYLDGELARLRGVPGLFQQESRAPGVVIDALQWRIDAVSGASQRLRDLGDFVASSLASLPDGALVADSSGAVVLANARAAAYLQADSAAALKGLSLRTLLAKLRQESAPGWDELVASATTKRQPASGEGRHADGRDLLVQLGPCLNSNGEYLGLIVNLTDISVIRNAERQRVDMMRFLSHDLRAPQTAIIALLELMRADAGNTGIRGRLASIENSARRTLTLADDFVHLARAEAITPEFGPVDVAALLLDATDQLWAYAERRQIAIAQHFGVDAAPVLGERSMLLRAVVNLLHNALKFSPAGGRVTLTLACAAGRVRVTVSDDGPGISAPDQARLFQMFQHIDPPGYAGESGAGLGLAYVRTVVVKMGGSVAVESESGRGAHFTLDLPAAGSTDAA